MSPLHLRLEAPPVYFLHVPKTAGVSLRLLFESAYAPSDVLSLHHAKILNRTTLDELPRYRCYLCHFGIGLYDLVHDLAGHTNLLPITMLRDPVERAVSHYYYQQKNVRVGRDFLDPAYIQRVRPLIEREPAAWVDVPELADVICDVQVRELGIPYDWRPFFKPAAGDGPDLRQTPRPDLVPVGEAGWRGQADLAAATAAACRRLDDMAVVGLTERFDESVEMICALLGIPKPARTVRANVGPHAATGRAATGDARRYQSQEKPEFLEQIRAVTPHDQALYAHARDLFEQQWARHRAATSRTYSIGPCIRLPVRRLGRASWQRISRALPAPEQAPRLYRWKSWLEQRL